MGTIYCLYSSADGEPRYVDQTEQPIARCRRQHVAAALRGDIAPVSKWIREIWAVGQEVEIHPLQEDVLPHDLNFYEEYWISQFPNLVNARSLLGDVPTESEAGRRVTEYLKSKVGIG
jgi:hypothetical protein